MSEKPEENLTPYQQWKKSQPVVKKPEAQPGDENLTPYQRWKRNLGDTRPWDMVNPKAARVSEEVKNLRFSICKGCEFLTKGTNQCKKCGCLMHLKTQLAAAECPIGKWARADIEG